MVQVKRHYLACCAEFGRATVVQVYGAIAEGLDRLHVMAYEDYSSTVFMCNFMHLAEAFF